MSIITPELSINELEMSNKDGLAIGKQGMSIMKAELSINTQKMSINKADRL